MTYRVFYGDPLAVLRSDNDRAGAEQFDTEQEAVALANDTPYGLSAYIQSPDVSRINRLIPRLKAGTVYVNPGPNPITCAGTPFGGCGTSGFGREGGKAGLDEFIHVKGVGIGRL